MLSLKLNFLCFCNIFEFWCYAVHCLPQFTQRLTTGILNVALGWTFQFFHDERDKKTRVFQIRSCLVTDSLVDQSMLFTHLYFMQGEKIEAWFVSQASR